MATWITKDLVKLTECQDPVKSYMCLKDIFSLFSFQNHPLVVILFKIKPQTI